MLMPPPLTQILHKGAPGGHAFAHIVKMLFEAEEKSGDGFVVKNFDDCAGDIDGADAFIEQNGRSVRVQIKFYASPFKPNQRQNIIADYAKAKSKMTKGEEWMLITPEGLQAKDMVWFNEQFGNSSFHKGETYLTSLFFKHPEVGQYAYPNHEFKKLVREYETPKDAESYFLEFLKPNANVETLFANAQPTYYDCKRVFKEEWCELMGDVYNEFYRGLIGVAREKERLNTKTKVRINTPIVSNDKPLIIPPEAYSKDVVWKVISHDVPHYNISFLDENNSDYTYKHWTYLNGRWVFFGKIQRFFHKADKIRNGNDIRVIMYALKCIRARQMVKGKADSELRLLAGEIVRNLKKG